MGVFGKIASDWTREYARRDVRVPIVAHRGVPSGKDGGRIENSEGSPGQAVGAMRLPTVTLKGATDLGSPKKTTIYSKVHRFRQ